jgi:hypothetical protein
MNLINIKAFKRKKRKIKEIKKMNTNNNLDKPKFSRQVAQSWNPNKVEIRDKRFNYDNIQEEFIIINRKSDDLSKFNALSPEEQSSLEELNDAYDELEIFGFNQSSKEDNFSVDEEEIELLEEVDSDDKLDDVSLFNKHHNTNFTETEIDRIYCIADNYSIKTLDAIKYSHNCHKCGDETVIGHEFCKDSCYTFFETQTNVCFWGKDCKMCYEIEKYNVDSGVYKCDFCEEIMNKSESNIIDNDFTKIYCNECYNMFTEYYPELEEDTTTTENAAELEGEDIFSPLIRQESVCIKDASENLRSGEHLYKELINAGFLDGPKMKID